MILKSYPGPAIIIVALLFSASSAFSQVAVKRSDNKVSIGGTPYYIHIVDSAQTVYSISKAYNVSSEVITRENPNALYGIRLGQALKIPVVEESEQQAVNGTSIPQKDTRKYNYHILQKGETIYSLSRKYDVPEEQIYDSNPGMDVLDIPVGTEIAIPKREFREQTQYFQTGGQSFILHRVERGETISSIARKYNISVRLLRDANDRARFVREGSYIRIPQSGAAVTEIEDVQVDEAEDVFLDDDAKLTYLFDGSPVNYTPVENLSGRVKAAIMLPLYLEENSKRSYIDSSEYNQYGKRIYKVIKRPANWIYPRSEIFLEFYEGALLAVETLRDKGLSVDLTVYDTRADSMVVRRIIESGKLDDTDIIIGPVYSYNVDRVARYARDRRIMVVSPLAEMNPGVLNNNPYLFKVQPSIDIVQSALASTISNFYDHNIIFVHSDTAYNKEQMFDFRNKIIRQLRYKVPFNEIHTKEVFFVSRSNYNDTINIIDHAMSREMPNLVVLASDNEAVMSEVLGNVHTLLRNYDVKVIGYPDLRWLENLDPVYFYELGLMMYTPNWVDYSQEDVKEFIRKYRDKFNTEPPVKRISYAWQAYDIAYYFLSGIAIQGNDFKYRPSQHHPDLLQVDYNFKRNGLRDGFENNRLYLIRYRPDFTIEFIREENSWSRE